MKKSLIFLLFYANVFVNVCFSQNYLAPGVFDVRTSAKAIKFDTLTHSFIKDTNVLQLEFKMYKQDSVSKIFFLFGTDKDSADIFYKEYEIVKGDTALFIKDYNNSVRINRSSNVFIYRYYIDVRGIRLRNINYCSFYVRNAMGMYLRKRYLKFHL